MKLNFNFDEPLLISQRDLDVIECKVINPFLFVSEESGGYLTDDAKVMSQSIPKQMPTGLTEEKLQKAYDVVDKVAKSVMVIQLVSQIFLKGSLESILSLYYSLQLICYVYNIFLLKQFYSSNLEIFILQLTKLIEFRSLQPEPLIQLYDEEFELDDYLQKLMP